MPFASTTYHTRFVRSADSAIIGRVCGATTSKLCTDATCGATLLQEEAPLRTDARKGYRKDAQHYEELSRCLDVAWEWMRRNPKVQAR